jgi:uncharacterized membrane protein
MSYQEKENIVNIFSALFITVTYALIVYHQHLQGQFDLTEDFSRWGIIFLIFIGVSIIARIIIYIIFSIINTIAMRREEKPISDERDKLIKLKSTRNSHYVFSIGFMLSIIALAIGMPFYGIFIAFIGCCLLSELIDNGSQIYYNRRGI